MTSRAPLSAAEDEREPTRVARRREIKKRGRV